MSASGIDQSQSDQFVRLAFAHENLETEIFEISTKIAEVPRNINKLWHRLAENKQVRADMEDFL